MAQFRDNTIRNRRIAQSANFHSRGKLTRLALISGGMLIGGGGARNYPLHAAARSTNFTYVESVYPPTPIRIIPSISGFSRSRRKAEENRDRLFFLFFPSSCARMWKRVHGKGVCAFSPNNYARARARDVSVAVRGVSCERR